MVVLEVLFLVSGDVASVCIVGYPEMGLGNWAQRRTTRLMERFSGEARTSGNVPLNVAARSQFSVGMRSE